METFHSLEGCDSKVGKISDVESHFSTFGVGVALLTRLCSFQMVADELDLLFCFSENIGSKHLALSYLRPVERGLALSSVKSFQRCHLEASLVAIVVCELGEG
jgi:hypothetical protein